MTLLLIIIYLSFISLGLPDSVHGSAWPSMYASLGVSIDSAGILSMIVSVGTVFSSLLSDRLNRRFGAGLVTFVSVALTAGALLGFSISGSFALLCLFAIPLGLGAGSVDAALNNFVALHYKANHMNWLHCFWGLGASLGPILMAYNLAGQGGWNAGYRLIGLLQLALAAILLFSLPLWKKTQAKLGTGSENSTEKPVAKRRTRELIALPGVKQVLLAFACYCGLELTVGLWGSTYLVTIRGLSAETAAGWVSLYYFGITFGRFLAGFLAMKLAHKQLVQLGQLLVGCGIVVLLLPLGGNFVLAGLFLMGLGLAPIYPSLLHETPISFGREVSQAIIGLQMACAYVGTSFVPPLFGLIGANISFALFPLYSAVLLLVMAVMVVQLHQKTKKKR